MLKKIFILLFLLLITVYLAIAVTVLNGKPDGQTCVGMELVINDSIDYGFITKKEVLRILNIKKLSPLNQKMDDINTRQLEDELRKHPLISNAECYRTSDNRIGIEITQRLPILRVMAANGENYYIDIKGETMPIPESAADVAIVTGHVTKAFATKELYEFGMFLRQNPLWQAQIQQINVTPTKELELVPRVGDHIIFLGKPGNYEDKFERLKTFYKKGLNEIGWNKYSRISLEFNNQIIGTKKEK
jgi:cell division protein FtsQ